MVIKTNNVGKYIWAVIFAINIMLIFHQNNPLYRVLIVAFIVLFLIASAINKRGIKVNAFLLLNITFLIYMGCSALWEQGTFPIKEYIVNILIGIIEIVLFNVMCWDKENVFIIIKGIIISALIVFAYAIVFYGLEAITSTRISNDLMNSNVLGFALSSSAIFALYLFLKESKKIYLFLIFVLGIGAIFTGSKGSILDLISGVVLIIILKDTQRIGKTIRNLIIAAIIMVVVYELLMEVPDIYNIVGFRIESLVNQLLGREQMVVGRNSNYMRYSMFMYGIQKIAERPFLGFGFDSFRTFSNFYGDMSHSNIIELLFGFGIIGAILYYSRIYILIKMTISGRKSFVRLDLAMVFSYIIRYCLREIYAVSFGRVFDHLILIIMYYIVVSNIQNLKEDVSDLFGAVMRE